MRILLLINSSRFIRKIGAHVPFSYTNRTIRMPGMSKMLPAEKSLGGKLLETARIIFFFFGRCISKNEPTFEQMHMASNCSTQKNFKCPNCPRKFYRLGSLKVIHIAMWNAYQILKLWYRSSTNSCTWKDTARRLKQGHRSFAITVASNLAIAKHSRITGSFTWIDRNSSVWNAIASYVKDMFWGFICRFM